MTKLEEINALTQFIASLPKQSYLRPWLESVQPEVVRAIKLDLMPSATVAEVTKSSAGVVAEAQRLATNKVKDAEQRAEKIVADANKLANNTLYSLRHRIQQALDNLPR